MDRIVQVKGIRSLADAQEEMERVGVDPTGIGIMAPKAVFRVIKITGLSSAGANILKQEMLSKGGEAAVAKEVVTGKVAVSDVLLFGTLSQYQKLIGKIQSQPFGMKQLAAKIEETLKHFDQRGRVLSCRDREVKLGDKTLIMGIVNLTPDSFSDGGRYESVEDVLAIARQMVAEGADMIDVGGESSRPGSDKVSLEEELRRLSPYLPSLIKELDVPISLDTYKPEVAKMGLDLGVHIINDIWGLQRSPDMAKVVARYGAGVIVMHNQEGVGYDDLMTDVYTFLERSIYLGEEAGLSRDRIMIDPGIGFGKTWEHNLEIMARLEEFRGLGCPLVVGTSRKSFIGQVLDLPVEEREEGTSATVALSVAKGADIVRVHDVRTMARVAKMSDGIVRWKHG